MLHACDGRVLEWHSRGQRFDPACLHHFFISIYCARLLRTINFSVSEHNSKICSPFRFNVAYGDGYDGKTPAHL